ncbi:hypothetical protein GCM10020295_79920 [Streptomyces cinereospinus]
MAAEKPTGQFSRSAARSPTRPPGPWTRRAAPPGQAPPPGDRLRARRLASPGGDEVALPEQDRSFRLPDPVVTALAPRRPRAGDRSGGIPCGPFPLAGALADVLLGSRAA